MQVHLHFYWWNSALKFIPWVAEESLGDHPKTASRATANLTVLTLCKHTASIVTKNSPKIKPYRSGNTRHPTRGRIMLKLKRGNSFTHHFVDDLMFLCVANSVPLADGPCPVLSPPSTDHDASVNQCSDNRPCVWDLAGQCAFWAWLLPTHGFTYVWALMSHDKLYTECVRESCLQQTVVLCSFVLTRLWHLVCERSVKLWLSTWKQ